MLRIACLSVLMVFCLVGVAAAQNFEPDGGGGQRPDRTPPRGALNEGEEENFDGGPVRGNPHAEGAFGAHDYGPLPPGAAPLIYINRAGTFTLPRNFGEGVARYVWQGRQYKDTLVYIDTGDITDDSGIGYQVNRKVPVALYKAFDNNATWYLAFGLQPLDTAQNRYPVYYSFRNPLNGGKLRRWVTNGGTRRE